MIEPFLKWPGGKRWLVKQYADIFPVDYDRYFEPFLGAGAVFFHLTPRRAVLADGNGELINLYQRLKQDSHSIQVSLARLQKAHCSSLYYKIRDQRPTDPQDRAIRFLYLNRTCFNGIYRVNLRGDFNVPMGSKTTVEFPPDYLEQVARRLRGASVRYADFEETLADAQAGDFVFIDPPYTVMHNQNNFVKYNASLFSWADQIRLAGSIRAASRRGAMVMLSNADHPSVRDLYRGFGNHYQISRSSILSASASFRRRTTELLVTNFAIPRLSHLLAKAVAPRLESAACRGCVG